jgi:signal peptidase I
VKFEKRKTIAQGQSRLKRIQSEMFGWLWVIAAFLLINGTVCQARVIPSGSMENTLLMGDHLIMSRIGYDAGVPFTTWHKSLWRAPRRQQMVIFKSPLTNHSEDIIKRVIGLPRESVEIREGAVWINGKELPENYTTGPTERYGMRTPHMVPDNCYFVMGDNRGNSYDSRFEGCIPRANIIGAPVMIYMSLDAPSVAWEPGHTPERFRAYASAIVHPSQVRWQRLFHIF